MSPGQVSVPGRFLATVKQHALLPEGAGVLVALSGGADSVCLLDLLRLVQPRLELRLAAFHLNHGLRRTAARDEDFVRALCREWRVSLTVVRARVGAYAKRYGLGIEEAGRKLRYRRLKQAAREQRCDLVALGHNANDNLETMLLNLARGAGPHGLAGMRPRRSEEPVVFVRPLIDLERGQIERHLRARGIAWVEDESNADASYRRNLLRHEVVPVLVRLNRAVVANAGRAARLLGDEDDFLGHVAAAAARDVAGQSGARAWIDTAKLRGYHDAVKRRVLKRLLPELDAQAVEAVLELCRGRPGGRLTLTRGVRARRHQNIMEFERSEETR